ncbi:hypothetical protein D3C84_1169750 [compost metagenome]
MLPVWPSTSAVIVTVVGPLVLKAVTCIVASLLRSVVVVEDAITAVVFPLTLQATVLLASLCPFSSVTVTLAMSS